MESLVPLASHPAVRAAQDALRAARYAAFEAAFTDPHLVRHPSIASGMFRRAVRVVWHDGWWVTDLVRRPPYFTVEEWSKERDCWENAKIAGFTWAEAKIIAEHIERTRPE